MQSFGTRPPALHAHRRQHSSISSISSFSISPSLPISTPPTPISPPECSPLGSSSSSSSSLSESSLSSLRRSVLISGIDNLIVPKNRRPKFDLKLEIQDLNNVPLVSGQAYVKWYVEGQSRADCHGRTNREPIKDHKVFWRYSHEAQGLRMTIGRDAMLHDQFIVFEVFQEHPGGSGRIQLGSVRLNLAEYAGMNLLEYSGKALTDYAEMKSVNRRHLMQNSKINSTLRVGITMQQVDGDKNYEAPTLKNAQVFNGIAGIGVAGTEQRDHQDDARSLSSLSSKNRDTGATQDMYRRTLAASWQLQVGELNADDCIEDIFAGGDGWVSSTPSTPVSKKSVHIRDPKHDVSDSDSISAHSAPGVITHVPILKEPQPHVFHSVGFAETKDPRMRRRIDDDAKSFRSTSTMSVAEMRKSSIPRTESATSSIRSIGQLHAVPLQLGKGKSMHEVDEMEARDDWVSWRMPQPASSVR